MTHGRAVTSFYVGCCAKLEGDRQIGHRACLGGAYSPKLRASPELIVVVACQVFVGGTGAGVGGGVGVGDGPGPETQSSVVLPQVDSVEEGTPRGMQRDVLRETGLSLHPGFLDRNRVIAMWFH